LLVLFGLTLFLAGALLFVVEPMFAKMVLPKLGGTPAVWNVCMVFYQALLLAGYVYAHEITKRFGLRRTALLQIGIVSVALFALPIRLPQILHSPLNQNPTVWLLALLAVGMGLPFLVLTTYNSTLQTWYTSVSSSAGAEPYFLYSASNLGSALGLFAYPLVLERYTGLGLQGRLWQAGYIVLVVLTAGCGLTLWFVPKTGTVDSRSEPDMLSPITRRQAFKWVALAFIPSSLMLGVTTALTTELPPIPLLWVLPLAIYLLSFILVFAKKPITYQDTIVQTLPILLLLMAFPIASKAALFPMFSTIFYLVVLFFACMACHGELATSRPPATRLTQFYLCLAVGGVLGGLFNAIVAPLIFKSVVELPLALFLLAIAIAYIGAQTHKYTLNRWDLGLPAALGLALAIVSIWLRSTNYALGGPMMNFAVFAPALLLCFSFAQRPLRFALGYGALLLASSLYSGQYGHVLLTERSFFGVYRVSQEADYRQLIHGSTIHGIQSLNPSRSREPLSYYYKTGPIGQVFLSPSLSDRLREVAVIGLGAGSLACYEQPWRHFTYYEIDPMVESIARNPRYFTLLRDCSPGTKVVIGDARLSLQNAPAHHYEMVIADAFSSDTVPAHLVTREAIQLYLTKLTEHGLLAFNISNRYLDLRPVLGSLAQDAGLACTVQEDLNVSADEQTKGKFASTWLLMARHRSDLEPLESQPNWHQVQVEPRTRVWTDDYSSIAGIIHWN